MYKSEFFKQLYTASLQTLAGKMDTTHSTDKFTVATEAWRLAQIAEFVYSREVDKTDIQKDRELSESIAQLNRSMSSNKPDSYASNNEAVKETTESNKVNLSGYKKTMNTINPYPSNYYEL